MIKEPSSGRITDQFSGLKIFCQTPSIFPPKKYTFHVQSRNFEKFELPEDPQNRSSDQAPACLFEGRGKGKSLQRFQKVLKREKCFDLFEFIVIFEGGNPPV